MVNFFPHAIVHKKIKLVWNFRLPQKLPRKSRFSYRMQTLIIGFNFKNTSSPFKLVQKFWNFFFFFGWGEEKTKDEHGKKKKIKIERKHKKGYTLGFDSVLVI